MILFHTYPSLAYDIAYLMANGAIPICAYEEFTLFGLKQTGETLQLLPDESYVPYQAMLDDTESTFDYYYWKQLRDDPRCEMELLKILVPEMNEGSNRVILIQTDYSSPFRTSITESLIGFLRTFYGLEPKLIMSREDINEDTFRYSPFSYEGLCRLTSQIEKYQGGG